MQIYLILSRNVCILSHKKLRCAPFLLCRAGYAILLGLIIIKIMTMRFCCIVCKEQKAYMCTSLIKFALTKIYQDTLATLLNVILEYLLSSVFIHISLNHDNLTFFIFFHIWYSFFLQNICHSLLQNCDSFESKIK